MVKRAGKVTAAAQRRSCPRGPVHMSPKASARLAERRVPVPGLCSRAPASRSGCWVPGGGVASFRTTRPSKDRTMARPSPEAGMRDPGVLGTTDNIIQSLRPRSSPRGPRARGEGAVTTSQGSWQPGPSRPSPHSASLRNPAHGRLTHKHPRAQIQLYSSVTSARLPRDPAGDGSPPATMA